MDIKTLSNTIRIKKNLNNNYTTRSCRSDIVVNTLLVDVIRKKDTILYILSLYTHHEENWFLSEIEKTPYIHMELEYRNNFITEIFNNLSEGLLN